MVTIFDLTLTPMSESVHNSLTELLDPENVGVAFGMSLLSSIEAEILRCFISTSDFRRPSLICDSRRIRSVWRWVPLCSLTTIMLVEIFDATLYISWYLSFSCLLPVYGRHLGLRYRYSLYIIEVQLGRPTVQWKSQNKIPTRSED